MIKVLVQTIPDNIPEGVTYERYEPDKHRSANVTGWLRISHIGKVLSTGEHNWHDDSDFFAVVWDAEKDEPREIEYASTRGWTYANSATIDATPDIVAKYEAWDDARAQMEDEQYRAAEEATPRAGKTVRVTKGRKVPLGTVHTVAWYGPGKIFGGSARRQGTPPMRVGLDIDGDRVFIAASNVQVIPTSNVTIVNDEFYEETER